MAIKSAGKNNVWPCTGTARACGLGHNMHSRYYATTRIYDDGASSGFVVTLRYSYRLAAACPSMVWLLQLPPLHMQREGKLMKVLTRIMPSNVGSEQQAMFAAKEHTLLKMLSYQGSQSCLHVYHTVQGQATASL